MGVVSLLTLGMIGLLIVRMTSPDMAPLYSGLSLEDSAAIVKELQGTNTPFTLADGGETILVPRDSIDMLRMTLAGDGLPTHGQVGYEIFDQQSTLGATSFVQNINNVRALEGELSRTITSIRQVKAARVHLVLPQRALFQQQADKPSAAIMLTVQGQLARSEVAAIQHLVAAAVEGLTPDRVSIVDDHGELLASGAEGGDDVLGGADAQERRLALEERLRSRLESLLDNVLGPGRARVEVSAQLDRERSTSTSETFDPNGQVVRSSQTRDIKNSAGGPAPGGEVSVANNLPGGNANGESNARTQQGSTSEETTNYEISKTTRTLVTAPGGIKRLSVAVVVDGVYTDNDKGKLVYQPRSQAELDQIKTLVQSAVGFDQQRGDQVSVVNMQFANRPAPSGGADAAPSPFSFTHGDIVAGAQMAVTLLIALALILFIMRPLLRKALSPEAPPLTLPRTAEIAPGIAESGAQAGVAGEATELAEAPQAALQHVEGQPADWIEGARTLGESQLKTIQSVGTLVEDNPRQAAMVVRDWLNSAA